MHYLSTSEAAQALTDLGIPTAKTTLQKKRCIGGGPIFQKFGNRVFYTDENLLLYVKERMSAPVASSSELAAGGA